MYLLPVRGPGAKTAILLVPGANHGPSPQRQQRGPPAQSSSYPCGPAQASPLPPASGQTRDETKEETPSRQKSKRIGFLSWILDPIVPDPAPSSFPLQSLFPLNMLLFGGFRRISKKNVLEHEARHVIYQAITATPGIDVKTLTDMTGINENTLRYHVGQTRCDRQGQSALPARVSSDTSRTREHTVNSSTGCSTISGPIPHVGSSGCFTSTRD